MHSGTRRGIRACRLVTWAKKAGFDERGFVFQFCDNQNLGGCFEKFIVENQKFATFGKK
jgi:hypothetical protein